MPPKRKKRPYYTVSAIYIGESIDLKKAQEGLKHWNFLNKDHPLTVRIEAGRFFCLTKFGVLIEWNMRERAHREVLKELSPYVRSRETSYPYSESIRVGMSINEHDKVLPSRVFLVNFSLERIKLISFVLAQSVALERYEDEIENSLSEAGKNIIDLKAKGIITAGARGLMRQIGQTMSVKQITVAHLSLFDKPEEAWESPELEKLYTTLRANFELTDRFDVLNEKIDFLSENARMLVNMLGERRMLLLEFIIVIFFAIDILLMVIDAFK